eukprot:280449_1
MGNYLVPTCCDEIFDDTVKDTQHKLALLSRRYTTTQLAHIINHNKNNKVYAVVTDLSGLTRLTREYSVIHAISIIMRQRQILYPRITNLLNPLTIEYEADNLIILFTDPMSELLCGLLIFNITNKCNQSLPQNKKHFQILIDGIGIDVIDGINNEIIQDAQTDILYNISNQDYVNHNPDPFHHAHILAENAADNGQYLISSDFYNEIQQLSMIKSQQILTFERIKSEKFGDFITISGDYSNFVQAVLNLKSYPPKICSINNKTYTSDKRVLKVIQRYNFEQDEFQSGLYIQNLDVELNKKYLIKNCAALMFNINIISSGNDTNDKDDEKMITKISDKQKIFIENEIVLLNFLNNIYDVYGSDDIYEIGKSWLIFRLSVINCFKCALKLQKSVEEFNTRNDLQINISGIGCDYGDVFMISNSDICFGDPINSASKLGEDIAKNNGDIMISERFYETIKREQSESIVKDCSFEERVFTVSDVEIKAFCVYRNNL